MIITMTSIHFASRKHYESRKSSRRPNLLVPYSDLPDVDSKSAYTDASFENKVEYLNFGIFHND